MGSYSDSSVCSYTFYLNGTTHPLLATYAADATLFIDQVLVPTRQFRSKGILFANDSAESIFFSSDGITDHGEIKPSEVIILDNIVKNEIYIRGNSAGLAYRFWAW